MSPDRLGLLSQAEMAALQDTSFAWILEPWPRRGRFLELVFPGFLGSFKGKPKGNQKGNLF